MGLQGMRGWEVKTCIQTRARSRCSGGGQDPSRLSSGVDLSLCVDFLYFQDDLGPKRSLKAFHASAVSLPVVRECAGPQILWD
jgi:hypothetical protein